MLLSKNAIFTSRACAVLLVYGACSLGAQASSVMLYPALCGSSTECLVTDKSTGTDKDVFMDQLKGLSLLYEATSLDQDPLTSKPGGEGGPFEDSYSTEFVFTLLSGGAILQKEGYTGANITNDGNDSINCSPHCYLLVGDGADDPARYLFDLRWDGKMDLALSGFWKVRGTSDYGGSMSRVAIYGVSAVPVPAAFWLFGTALIGFIGLSRKTRV